MVWDCSRATEVGLSVSLAEERAWLRCLDGYAGSGGSEWVGGETDSDDDYYSCIVRSPQNQRKSSQWTRPTGSRTDIGSVLEFPTIWVVYYLILSQFVRIGIPYRMSTVECMY